MGGSPDVGDKAEAPLILTGEPGDLDEVATSKHLAQDLEKVRIHELSW